MVKVDFKLPPGVQLFTVYVWEHELEMLRKRATAFQHPTAGDDAETRVNTVNLLRTLFEIYQMTFNLYSGRCQHSN